MNLLTSQKKRKIMARPSSRWAICKEHNGKMFFIHDIHEDTGAVMWSPILTKAVRFRTERGCLLFIRKTIGGRKDVFVWSLSRKKGE